MTRKRLLAAVLGTAVALGGCGAMTDEIAPAATQEKVKLRVSGYKAGAEIGAIPELNDLFMKENPDIQIVYEGMPGVQYNRYIRNKFAVNDAPDVIMLHPGVEQVGGYAKAGFIRELSGEPWVGRFTPSSLEAVSYSGKVYGTPNDMVVLGVFYNRDLFDRLALSVPESWDEFLEACASLKAAGVTPISIGNNDGWMTLAALLAMGSTLLQEPEYDRRIAGREIKFNGTWNKMTGMWYDLDDKGYLTPDSTAVSLDQAQKEFTDGRAGMYVNGSWALAGLRDAAPDFRIGMFAMPAGNAAEETVLTVAAGTTWTINSKTKHTEAARKYLEFWTRESNLRKWTQSQAAFLTLKGAASDVPPELADIAERVEKGPTKEFLFNRWEHSGMAVQELMDSAQGVYLGAITIEQMLTNMDEAWDRAVNPGGGER